MPEGFRPGEARQFYDRFGSKQDYQAFYEDRATTELLRQTQFENADKVFELGCGTGRFAQKLFKYLPEISSYLGVDISPKMVELARRRLEPWSGRAQVHPVADPPASLTPDNGSFDRFISNYVLDLLSPEQSFKLMAEAHRILTEGGLLAACRRKEQDSQKVLD